MSLIDNVRGSLGDFADKIASSDKPGDAPESDSIKANNPKDAFEKVFGDKLLRS